MYVQAYIHRILHGNFVAERELCYCMLRKTLLMYFHCHCISSVETVRRSSHPECRYSRVFSLLPQDEGRLLQIPS